MRRPFQKFSFRSFSFFFWNLAISRILATFASDLKCKFSPSPRWNFEKGCGLYTASKLRLSRNHGKSVRFPSLPLSTKHLEYWNWSGAPLVLRWNPSTFSFQVTSRGVFSRTAPRWLRTRRRTGIWAWLPTVPWCSSWRTRIWRRTTSATSCSAEWGSCAGRGLLRCACSACRQSRSSCWFTVSEENSSAGLNPWNIFIGLDSTCLRFVPIGRVVSIQIRNRWKLAEEGKRNFSLGKA